MEYLKEVLRYEPETGYFYWTRNIGKRVKAGDRAGSDKRGRYRRIVYKGKSYSEHRLAFFFMGKPLPEQVDHINHNKLDNRWENLRAADHQINKKNYPKSKRNTSGFVGVSKSPRHNSWIAVIAVDGKNKYLGSFKSIDDAIEARRQANMRYGYHENHGVV